MTSHDQDSEVEEVSDEEEESQEETYIETLTREVASEKVKNGSAGYDNIDIKENTSIMAILLKYAINREIQNSSYPDSLKVIKIIPIYKGGNKNEAKSYRPICITSILAKTYDKILNNRLMNYLESNNLITQHQHAYRKNHSCNTALISM